MSTTNKLTESLSIKSLKDKFFIGTVNAGKKQIKINALQDAIDDGTLLGMFQDCASQLYNGEVYQVVLRMKKNLANWKCVAKAPTVADKLRYELLWNFCEKIAPDAKTTAGKARAHEENAVYVDGVRKPQYAYGPADIDQISDPKKLQAIINSIADVCANKAGCEEAYKRWLGEDYMTIANQNREYALNRKHSLVSSQPTNNVLNVLSSLEDGQTLTKEQLLELFKLRG